MAGESSRTGQPFRWEKAEAFYERVDRLSLHGLHFQHVALCPRRAWCLLHGVDFAPWNDRVQRGLALHDLLYSRDRSVLGLIGLYPDRIDWESRIVYEQKGSGGAKEAVNDQAAFYALMLSIATGKTWRACVRIVPGKRKREVVLDEARLERLWRSSLELERLAALEKMPSARRLSFCPTCSLAKFCGFDR